jgi:hypothetical protein
MGRKLVAEPGSVPAVGEDLLLTTLSEAYRPGGVLPEPEQTPWTHGGPPAPYDPLAHFDQQQGDVVGPAQG